MNHLNIEHPTFEDLELLAEVSQLLKLTDLDRVLQQVINLAAKSVGADKASLFLHEDERIDWGHIFTSRNLSPDEEVRVVEKVLDQGFAGWVYQNKKGDIILDTETDERWIKFPNDPLVVRSALCMPFITDTSDSILAVVTLVHSEPNHFTEYHLRLLTIVANQATVAIRNSQLFSRIKSQQRQLEAILHSMSEVLLVLDQNGTVLLANDATLNLLRLPELPERDVFLSEFVAIDQVFEPIAEIIQSQGGQPGHWSFETRSEAHQTDYQATMSIWNDVLDGVAGYVVVMHDVTMLRDLHRFKDEMLRVASHDLRSPLALIAGYADMIEMDLPDRSSPIFDYIDVIKRSTERMGGLLEDLLRVERIRSSPLELHEQTDLEQLVKVVLVNLRPLFDSKTHTLDTHIDLDNILRIQADPVLIRQAMENLLSNAIKYTPPGGTIQVSAYFDDQRFYFKVVDSGVGIPEEHLQRVFESFYRVQQTVTNEKGSGLGLSLVRNVIERHQGDVWVKSTLGKGSEFGFWLPLPV